MANPKNDYHFEIRTTRKDGTGDLNGVAIDLPNTVFLYEDGHGNTDSVPWTHYDEIQAAINEAFERARAMLAAMPTIGLMTRVL